MLFIEFFFVWLELLFYDNFLTEKAFLPGSESGLSQNSSICGVSYSLEQSRVTGNPFTSLLCMTVSLKGHGFN